jgi:hypothetical protein
LVAVDLAGTLFALLEQGMERIFLKTRFAIKKIRIPGVSAKSEMSKFAVWNVDLNFVDCADSLA